MDTVPLTPQQREQLEVDDMLVEASMLRHPAGKARDLSRCPMCGTRASGALGEPAYST